MNISTIPFWRVDNFNIIGAEGEENSSGGEGNEGGDGSGGGEDNEGGSENSTDGGNSGGAGSKESILADLARERRDRQKSEKELAALRREKQQREDAEKTENERLQGEVTARDERLKKLSTGFLNNRLDKAIERAARDLKFKDTDDALIMVDRSLIEYEQDEDDPTNITVKDTTVKAAVKKVAEKKPHLLTTGTGDGERSGSGFGGAGGTGGNNSDKDREAALAAKYPSL